MDSSSQKNSFNRGRSPFHYIQLHLSTAIVLMFVASGLLWANCQPFYYGRGFYTRGFPAPFLYSDVFQETMSHSFGPFEPVVLAIDALIGLAILAACGWVCECRIRKVRWSLIVTHLILFGAGYFYFLIVVTTLAQPWIGHRNVK